MARYPEMVLLPEHARRVIRAGGLDTIRQMPVRDFLLVANLLDEAEADALGGLAISDSGLINNLAHEALFFAPQPDRRELLTAFRHVTYDAVLWCDPADVPLVNDGQRILDDSVRARLHQEVGNALDAIGLQPLIVRGSRSERLAFASEVVANLLRS
jgi:hypothetical protein